MEDTHTHTHIQYENTRPNYDNREDVCTAYGTGGHLECPTCEHALIDDAGALDQDSVTRHDHPISWDGDDITRDQVCGHGLLDLCSTQHRHSSYFESPSAETAMSSLTDRNSIARRAMTSCGHIT